MKNTFFSFISVFLVLISIGMQTSVAQNQKIGYIKSDFILENMPEYQSIATRLDISAKEWRAEAEEMLQEIERLQKEFQAKEILFTDKVRLEKQKEIQAKIQARAQYLDSKFGPQGDYFKQQNDLLYPVQQKVAEAVTQVAERDGYDYIFDKTGEYLFIYTRQSLDISILVLEELGINLEDASN